MFLKLRPIHVLLVIVLSSMKFGAQALVSKPARESKPVENEQARGDKQKILSADQEQALWILNEISDMTSDIKEDQTRIKVQARVADAVWAYNEPRARRLFESAFQSIDSIKPEEKQSVSKFLKELSEQFQLRQEVLQLVSRHDRKLSEKFIKSIEETTETQLKSARSDNQSAKASLYLQLAMATADADPENAVQLIRASLNSGVDPMIVGALLAVRGRNASSADRAFEYALAVARRDEYPPLTINYLAPYVFPNYGQGISQSDAYLGASTATSNDLVTAFLGFSYDVLMQVMSAHKQSPNSNLDAVGYSTVQLMLPYFDQYMPDRGTVMRSVLTQFASTLPGDQVEIINTVTRVKDVDEILERAENARTQDARDAIYSQAAMMSARSGHTERALSIVAKIENEALRSNFDSVIRYQAALEALGKGDTELVYHYAKDVRNLQMRANVYSRLAKLFFDKKRDAARAGEILFEARETVLKADNALEKVRALFIITEPMVRIDVDSGFEFMSSAVRTVNQIDRHLERSCVISTANSKQTPTLITSALLGLNAVNFDESFSLLAQSDFQRALGLARSFDKKEAIVLAELAACKGVLAKAPTASTRTGKD